MKTPAVALITGAARRVGAKIATRLQAEGMNVILHCNTSLAEANVLCQQLNALRPDSAHVEQADFGGRFVDLSEWVARVVARWGRLDVLVNNASIFYPTTLAESTEKMWDDLMGINSKVPFFLSKAAAPFLAVHKTGSIVNITDIHGLRPLLKGYDIYCISKAALSMQTRVLARELAPFVRVNSIAPSAVAWPEGVNALSIAQQEKIVHKMALRRHGCPEDIANAVRFLAIEATYMTGQTLAVDGGRLLAVIGGANE